MQADSPSTAPAAVLGRERGIVALDFPGWEAAQKLVATLGQEVGFYKVGLELFTAEGPDAVRRLRDQEKRVFLDLKLHDIPNTVAGAVRAARHLGVSLVTIHASGGADMIRAAVEAAAEETRVIAVTALTSLSPQALPSSFRADLPLDEIVLQLTGDAIFAGAAGVVLSGGEVKRVKDRFGDRCLCVVPGVRPAGTDTHDQARVVTPERAIRDRADYLVLGRAITQADNPLLSWRQHWSFAVP